MAAYQVKVTDEARDGYNGFSRAVTPAIFNTLEGDLSERPNEVGTALVGRLAGTRSLTRGSYKIHYKVEGKTVLIIDITRR